MKKLLLLLAPYQNCHSGYFNKLKLFLIENDIEVFDMNIDRSSKKGDNSMSYEKNTEFVTAMDMNIPFILKNSEMDFVNGTCSIWNAQTNELNIMHIEGIPEFLINS